MFLTYPSNEDSSLLNTLYNVKVCDLGEYYDDEECMACPEATPFSYGVQVPKNECLSCDAMAAFIAGSQSEVSGGFRKDL